MPKGSSASSTSATPTRRSSSTTNSAQPLAGWSRTELLAQLLMVGASLSDLHALTSVVEQGVGGLVLFGAPAATAAPTIRIELGQLQRRSPHGLIISTDEEGGEVARLAHIVGAMPWPCQMAATMTPAQVQRLVETNAKGMTSLGVTMDLAPMLDTASPHDPVDDEAYRSFSESGDVAAEYGTAFMAGLRAAGVIAVAKHYPGLGHATADTDTGPATIPSLLQLQRDDLVPFDRVIAGGIPVVMMSNAVEPTWGAVAVSLNPVAYSYLRASGFTGVIITDALDAGAIAATGRSGPEAATQAIEAGADMALLTSWAEFGPALADLEHAVDDGQLPMARVEAAVERILQLPKPA